MGDLNLNNMKKILFSSKVRFVYIVNNIPTMFSDSIIVFETIDFDSAFKYILNLGKKWEKNYTNSEGETVIYKLKDILTIDAINFNKEIDFNEKICFEVHHTFIDIDEKDRFYDFNFKIDKSKIDGTM